MYIYLIFQVFEEDANATDPGPGQQLDLIALIIYSLPTACAVPEHYTNFCVRICDVGCQ